MKYKNYTIQILSSALIFLFLGSITTVQATIDWQESFENVNEWTITDYITQSDELITNPDPNEGFKIMDGILRAPNDSSFLTFKQAYRSSTTAYGNWSFDWWTPNTVGADPSRAAHDIISFIFNEPSSNYNASGMTITDYLYDISGYQLMLSASNASGSITDWSAPRITIDKLSYQGGVIPLEYYKFTDEITGIHHIEITRDLDNEFKVYFDSELIITVTDADITTSEVLLLVSYAGDSGFDNVTVDERITTTTESVSTTTTSTNEYSFWILLPVLSILVILRKQRKK